MASNEKAERAAVIELDVSSVLKQASVWVSPSPVNCMASLLRKKRGEDEELGYGALYGNIVTLPNGLNVAVPV